MEYTQLGRTGLKVSRLVLGTMNFGPQTDEADSHAIMDAALDAGINYFDTANVYGWGENKGRTESIIGTWLAPFPCVACSSPGRERRSGPFEPRRS